MVQLDTRMVTQRWRWPMALMLLTIGLSGCKDVKIVVESTEVSVDLVTCLGSATAEGGEAQSTCRPRLTELVGGGAVNVCFVAREDVGGAEVYYTTLKWDGTSLSRLSDGIVPVGAGKRMVASLYFMNDSFNTSQCAAGGLGVADVCGVDNNCVFKLSQASATVSDGSGGKTTVFDFSTGGRCDAVWAEDLEVTELCDGVDNDCDGVADEDIADLGDDCSVGAGECRRVSKYTCSPDGAGVVCDVVPGQPTAEQCNGLDDDCNSTVDDGLLDCCGDEGRPGACNKDRRGVCEEGTYICGADGMWGPCLLNGAPVPQPTAETCDLLDNDCDGNIDEDLFLTGCNGGVCPDGTLCENSGDCGAQQLRVGDDCVDGRGACAATGTVSCAAERPVCDAIVGEPSAEICDGEDNNCNGVIDEPYLQLEPGVGLGLPCSEGVGECATQGRYECAPSGDNVLCDAQAAAPTAELCDGLDNDCDTDVDETFVADLGQVCRNGNGVCESEGVRVCDPAAPAGPTICDAPERVPVEEICNLVDDDCDGVVDNGFELDTDPENCGACDRVCDLAGANSACEAGLCVIDSCLGSFEDLDGNRENGCECDGDAEDPPDPEFLDTNCDGVDGNQARAVFVSADAGDDGNDGVVDAPYRTLQHAFTVASFTGQSIYLDAGEYDITEGNAADFSRTGFRVPPGVNIHGGYRWDGNLTWIRAGRARSTSIITGSPVVLRYEGLDRVTLLDNVEVVATPPEADGAPTVAVMAIDTGDFLQIRDSLLRTEQGAAGVDGRDGDDGGLTAQPGLGGIDGDFPANPGQGGVGGINRQCPNGTAGGDGGNAVVGVSAPGGAGSGGDLAGQAGEAGAFGAGGVPGGVGGDGAHGRNGGPGLQRGRIQPDGVWVPRGSAPTLDGQSGGGGGGGGAGGPVNANNGTGGGGGGGGAGGCAGTAGDASTGGGGSFALQVSNGAVHLIHTVLQAGPGGRGGNGGSGGQGAPGNVGGLGGGAGGCVNCGDGGGGANGGRGGCGGHAGGGSGGPSFAVLRVSTSSAAGNLANSTIRFDEYSGLPMGDQAAATQEFLSSAAPSPAGIGGRRGNCGPAADDGADGLAGFIACCGSSECFAALDCGGN